VILHATTVARYGPAGWSAVLIRGASGTGKSETALRLLAAGWRLVADDRTLVWASGGRLWGRAPGAIAGLIEVRTVGIAPAPTVDLAPIVLVASQAEPGETLERIPEAAETEIVGVRLPELRLSLLEEGSPARLSAALTMLGRSQHPAYLALSRGPEASLAGGVSR
jgi:serine kinase of HPr protein (carbohydrate metabolism regulator)